MPYEAGYRKLKYASSVQPDATKSFGSPSHFLAIELMNLFSFLNFKIGTS